MDINTMEIMASSSDSAMNALLGAVMGLGVVSYLISMAVTIVVLIAEWKLLVKAGEPGWKILIPFYNLYTMYKIVYGNGWKFLLMIVPVLGTVISIAYSIRLAQVYGKGVGMGILNIFFSPIIICVLGFGDAQYEGPINEFL